MDISHYVKIFSDHVSDSDTIRIHASLAPYTTIACGGAADMFITPSNKSDLRICLELVDYYDLPLYILGKGSNLLIADSGVRGVVLSLHRMPKILTVNKGIVTASANIGTGELLHFCTEKGMSGIEFLCGIPGGIGGLCAMNAGAFGGEIGEKISQLTVHDLMGKEYKLDKDNMFFSYRSARFSVMPCLITEAHFSLESTNTQQVQRACEKFMCLRKSKHLWHQKTFGSVFKNGKDYYAGSLIDACNLKKHRVHGAYVSAEHANFIINDGSATATDVYQLMVYMQKSVKQHYDISLEPEVKLWGFDNA